MDIKFRRIIYISAIIIFLVASPLLLFYISGYRFDFYKKTIKVTGSLFITTKPTDADVFINNQMLKNKTPLRLNHLTPNFYSVRIEKENFQPYQKNLEVKTKETTMLENIILWPTSPEQNELLTGNINNFSIDPQERFILFQDDNTIKRYRLSNQEIIPILPIKNASTTTTITWSNDGFRALLNNNENYWLYTVDDKVINLSQKIQEKKLNNISTVKFDPDNSANLTFLSDKTLYAFNIQTSALTKLLDEPIKNYLYKNNKLYIITATDKVFLTNYSTNGEKTPLFQLPQAEDYEIIDIIQNQALVYTTSHHTMYFFTLDAENFNNTSNFISNVDKWEINSKKDTVLIYNTWEIWTYSIAERKSNLISRFSQPIQQSHWYSDNNYIFVSFADEIKAIELDNRDYRNTAEIWQKNPQQNFWLSTNGHWLYLLTNFNNTKRIIRLTIFEPDILFEF